MSPSKSASLTVRQFQSEVAAIRDAPEPLSTRLTVFVLAFMVVSFFVMSPFARLDRVVTSTSGKIVSAEAVQTYQALDDSSIVKTLDVKEGQQVAAGQLLATLDPTFTAADVDQLRLQVASLDAQIARAEAEQQRKPLTFPDNATPDYPKYVALQQSLYEQRAANYAAQVRSFDEKISQAQATIVKLTSDEGRYQEREKISSKIEDMRNTLVKSGSGSLLNALEATDQRLEMLRTREFGHNSLIEAQHTLSSVQADRDAFVQQWFTTVSQEIVTARNSRDTAAAQLSKAAKHQDLVRLTAAEPSVVLQVSKVSVGSVLKGGDPIMMLVPLRSPMEAEIQLATRDIGFVRPNDHVVIKVDAFDPTEHGDAAGHISWISEGVFTTDVNGAPAEPYYKARVYIDALNFTEVPSTFRLMPGMALSADIHVGTRSLFAYLLKGIMRRSSEAMREPG